MYERIFIMIQHSAIFLFCIKKVKSERKYQNKEPWNLNQMKKKKKKKKVFLWMFLFCRPFLNNNHKKNEREKRASNQREWSIITLDNDWSKKKADVCYFFYDFMIFP